MDIFPCPYKTYSKSLSWYTTNGIFDPIRRQANVTRSPVQRISNLTATYVLFIYVFPSLVQQSPGIKSLPLFCNTSYLLYNVETENGPKDIANNAMSYSSKWSKPLFRLKP